MAKLNPYYLILIVLLGLFAPAGAGAVAAYDPGDPGDGNPCPLNTYQLAHPAGTYPPSLDLCSSLNSYTTSVFNDNPSYYPCDQYIHVEDTPNRNTTLFFYPDPLDDFTTSIRYRFLIWGIGQPIFPLDYGDFNFKVSVYDQNTGVFVASANETLGDNLTIETFWTGSYNYYYNVYVVEGQITIPAAYTQDIYFTIRLNRVDNPGPFFYNVASIQFAASDAFNSLNYCPIPNTFPPLPATFTPTPVVGPTIFPTPRPTNPPATLVPTWTATPYVFITMLPPPRATPIPINTYSSISIPPLYTVAPISTGQPITLTVQAIASTRESEYTSMFSYTTDLATRWADPVNQAVTTVEITGTLGYSSTLETIDASFTYASYPFRFARTLKDYIPNTWPFWLVMLSAFALYVITQVIRFSVTIIVTLIEWIRRLWEAIPFN